MSQSIEAARIALRQRQGGGARYDADASNITKVAVAPKRGQIAVQFVALGWIAE